jgi:LysM repeat protein
MIKRILSILVIIQFFSISTISAQEIKRSDVIEVFNGEQYYLHSVTEGHTLYSLSQVYGVSVDEIIDANSYLEKGDDLPIDLIIRIPYRKESAQNANVYKHTVKKGETLYSIARQYELKVSELYNANPGLTTDISIGQEIIIPGQEKVETTPIIEPTVEDTIIGKTYIIHTVKEGETAYGISREYNVSLNELEILNPTILSQDLRSGMEILIPIYGKNIAAEHSDTISLLSCDCDEPILKETYNIALLIPLYLDQAYRIEYNEKENKTSESKFIALKNIPFYEGMLLAIDSLKKIGFNAKIHVFDVDKDEEKVQSIIQKPEMQNMDLIIGPWYDVNFSIVADFAEENEIVIVSPQSFICAAIGENPYVVKVVPDVQSQILDLSNYFNLEYPDANVIYVYKSQNKAMKNMGGILQTVLEGIDSIGVKYSYSVIDYSENGFSKVAEGLQTGKVNIIVSMISGEAFLSTYTNNLNKIRENHEVILVGLPGWFRYDKLDMVHYSNLNTHWFGSTYIDYSREDTKDFIEIYRDRFQGDPSNNAFIGYDLSLYFFSALHQYGRNFIPCLNNMDGTKLLQTELNFKEKTKGGGVENTFINIYRTYDYKLINAREYPYKDYPFEEDK